MTHTLSNIRVILRSRTALWAMVSVILLSGGHQPAQAQTTPGAPVIGEDIIVTATRTPTLRKKLGSAVTIITAEELEKQQLPTVADILRRTPGVFIQQNGPSGTSSEAKFRGLEEEHTLVLINGVKQNDPGEVRATFNFEHLLVSNIERIEIIRGPQATLYGSRASGAVINIITKKGAGDFSGQIKTEIGSNSTGLIDATGSGGGTVGKGIAYDYAVSGTALTTEGFSAANEDRIPPGFDRPTENDGAKNYSLSFNGGIRPTPDTEIRATFDHSNLFSEFDRTTSRRAVDDDRNKDKEVYSYSLSGRHDSFDGALENSLTVAGTNTSIRRIDEFVFSSGSDSWFKEINYQGTWEAADNHVLSFGVGYDQERYARLSGGTTANPGETLDERKGHTNYFVQSQSDFFDRLFITAGLSFDHFDGVHDKQTDGQWTYRGGVSYDVKETNTTLKASYATGFAAPTLFQQHRFTNATPLSSESTELWDAGFEQTVYANRIRFGATYFRNEVEDQIVFISTTAGYRNRDRMKSQGVEDFVDILVFEDDDRRLDFSVNHTWTLAVDQDTIEIDRVPRHRVNFAVDYGFLKGKANLRLDGEWEDSHKDFYDTSGGKDGLVRLGNHWRFDIAGDYKLTEQVKLHARIENIFDKKYETAAGFASTPFGVYGGLTYLF